MIIVKQGLDQLLYYSIAMYSLQLLAPCRIRSHAERGSRMSPLHYRQRLEIFHSKEMILVAVGLGAA